MKSSPLFVCLATAALITSNLALAVSDEYMTCSSPDGSLMRTDKQNSDGTIGSVYTMEGTKARAEELTVLFSNKKIIHPNVPLPGLPGRVQSMETFAATLSVKTNDGHYLPAAPGAEVQINNMTDDVICRRWWYQ